MTTDPKRLVLAAFVELLQFTIGQLSKEQDQ